MKTLNEYLIKNKLKFNRFGMSLKDLTGKKITSDDVTEGMYIKLSLDTNKEYNIYSIVKKKTTDGYVPVIWTYANISANGKCIDCFNDRNITASNTIGVDSPVYKISMYIMNENDYNYFIDKFNEAGIEIPEDFLLN